MRASNDHTQNRGECVGEEALKWMTVEGHQANRRRPLVVYFVDSLVQPWMMEQSADLQREDERRYADEEWHSLEMVVVVGFWRRKKGKVVSGVVNHGHILGQQEPDVEGEKMRAYEERTSDGWEGVGEEVLHRVSVHGD